jgi:hypothetical protein
MGGAKKKGAAAMEKSQDDAKAKDAGGKKDKKDKKGEKAERKAEITVILAEDQALKLIKSNNYLTIQADRSQDLYCKRMSCWLAQKRCSKASRRIFRTLDLPVSLDTAKSHRQTLHPLAHQHRPEFSQLVLVALM